MRWIGEVESGLGRRSVAVASVDLQAAQDDLLQPIRSRRNMRTRRQRIAVQTPAQFLAGARIAEGQTSGGKLIEHGAQRENIAPWVAAYADDLLRRHVDPVADGISELFGQEIGVLGVMRETEVDERSFTARTVEHVSRL